MTFTVPTLDFGPNVIPVGLGTLTTPERHFFGSSGQVYRRVDIFNADGTPFYYDAPVLDGSISVDSNRDERRTLELTLSNQTGIFRSDPTGFWYDKIIKVYRGVKDSEGDSYYFQLGEFLIDTISEPNFPPTVSVAGRDYTKRMMLSKFSAATAFGTGTTLESVINSLASNAGIARRNVPITGVNLNREFFFEAGDARWEAAKELAEAYGYELFFNSSGVLTMQPFVDPTTAPVQFTFLTGGTGNMTSFELITNDTRIYNNVVVKGTATNQLPVSGTASNVEPTSPTRIERLGQRTYVYDSKFVSSSIQANALAVSLLKIMALESYELSVEALVAPWLEAGVAVEFLNPKRSIFAPTRFLLSDFDIPLTLGTMQANARRVTIVD